MKAPVSFVYRNLVFGGSREDIWALYRVAMSSYDGLTLTEKQELLAQLASFGYGIEQDFQLLRVTRMWSPADYAAEAESAIDRRHGHPGEWQRYIAGHVESLSRRRTARPEVYLAVRLGKGEATSVSGRVTRALEGQGDGVGKRGQCRPDKTHGGRRERSPQRRRDERPRAGLSPGALLGSLRRSVGMSDARGIAQSDLDELVQVEEPRTFGRVVDYLDADRAATFEIQWLIRRGFTRGLGEPELDEHFQPQAAFVIDERDELRWRPLEHDVLRLFDSPITVGARSLLVESELGDSHQAMLCFGALPEVATFPGRAAELLFAPLEGIAFPVDAALSARYIRNDEALALTRRRIVDADNIWSEEMAGEHGPLAEAQERPHAARELEQYLRSGGAPPLLRASITLAVGAPTRETLEERLEKLRRAYGGAPKLHRPLGDQLRLFCQHFPGQPTQVRAYEDYLLVEQVGAMVPTATHMVGSDSGPYIGHTLSGSAQPVLFDLTEASRSSRPPSILCAGTLGSGKTMFLQLALYQSFLRGSRIVDIDPKGDHNLASLPGVSEHVEQIELSSDPAYRGMLDPLRIAPAGTEEDVATNFLIDVLPDPMPAAWKTEIRAAVKAVVARAGRSATCHDAIAELARGPQEAKDAARALEVYADTGLARLGFAEADSERPAAGAKQITSLRIRNLPRPIPGTPKADLSEDERLGQAVLRLLASYAMTLMGSDRSRHKVLGFDEAWFLLSDAMGRRLIENLNRWGRSEFATPILVTHLVADAEEVDNLIGARFVFGMESEAEAQKALALLRLDPDDSRLRSQLLGYRKGRCLMRDYAGRVAAIQVDLADPDLLAALDTTPHERLDAGCEADGARAESGDAAVAAV